MKIVTHIVQALISIGFGLPGFMKIMKPYEELAADPMMGWVNDFSPMQITGIGVLEVLGVLGMLLPFIIKKFKGVVPVAAAGAALLFGGAVITHIMRGENFVPPMILMAMAIFTVLARKGLLKGENNQNNTNTLNTNLS